MNYIVKAMPPDERLALWIGKKLIEPHAIPALGTMLMTFKEPDEKGAP
jgi:hypothetical protein